MSNDYIRLQAAWHTSGSRKVTAAIGDVACDGANRTEASEKLARKIDGMLRAGRVQRIMYCPDGTVLVGTYLPDYDSCYTITGMGRPHPCWVSCAADGPDHLWRTMRDHAVSCYNGVMWESAL